MECYICFESLQGLLDSQIIECEKHYAHKPCFILWLREKEQHYYRSWECPICKRPLPPSQMQKVCTFEVDLTTAAFNALQNDDAACVIRLINENMDKNKSFRLIVEGALHYKKINILVELRSKVDIISNAAEQHALIWQLYKKRDEMSLRWIFNDYTSPFEMPDDEYLGSAAAELFVRFKAFKELYWMYRLHLFSLPLDTRLSIGKILYQNLLKKWAFTTTDGVKETEKSGLFERLTKYHVSRGCQIWRDIAIPIIAEEVKDWESFRDSGFTTRLQKCAQCKGSHVLDAVKHAIATNNLTFLKALMGDQEALPFSKKDLQQVIKAAETSTDPKSFIVVLNLTRTPTMWGKVSKKLQAGSSKAFKEIASIAI